MYKIKKTFNSAERALNGKRGISHYQTPLPQEQKNETLKFNMPDLSMLVNSRHTRIHIS